MAKQIFGNNASSLLAASLTDADLVIQVESGFGALYPSPGVDEYFLVTLEDDMGETEIVKITARAGDLLTVPPLGRGQEGTSAVGWTNGQARVELRLTRGTMEQFLQRDGDEMTGNLLMNGNEIQEVTVTGNSQWIGGEIIAPLRGAPGDSSNEVSVPDDGSPAKSHGSRILTEADTQQVAGAAFVIGQIILWHKVASNIPPGWAPCDGAIHNGYQTPNLEDKFIVGAGGTYGLNTTGGSATGAGTTGAAGGHDHTAVTGDTALDPDQIPAHHHELYINTNAVSSDAQGFGVANDICIAGDIGTPGYRADNNTFANKQLVKDAGGGVGGGHHHAITAAVDHTHSLAAVPTIPPYHALIYIVFVGF